MDHPFWTRTTCLRFSRLSRRVGLRAGVVHHERDAQRSRSSGQPEMPCLRNWLLPAADLERLIDHARSDHRKFAGQQTMALPPNPDVSSVTELLEAIQALSCKNILKFATGFGASLTLHGGCHPASIERVFMLKTKMHAY